MSRAGPVLLDVDGERKTIAEWSAWAKATLGIDLPASVIRGRLKTGNWTAKLAVTKPVNLVLSVKTRVAIACAREERGDNPLLTRRGPAGLAPFLRSDAAGEAARAALPKAPPSRRTATVCP